MNTYIYITSEEKKPVLTKHPSYEKLFLGLSFFSHSFNSFNMIVVQIRRVYHEMKCIKSSYFLLSDANLMKSFLFI